MAQALRSIQVELADLTRVDGVTATMLANTPDSSSRFRAECHRVSRTVMWRRTPLFSLTAIAIFLLIGCTSPGSELIPVRGELYVGDEPAAGARVILNPVGGFDRKAWPGGLPNATVGDDGSFSVRTPPLGEGVSPGQYKLTAMWLVPAPGSDPNDPEPETTDRLEGRWANPNQSEIVVFVQAPGTDLERITLE